MMGALAPIFYREFKIRATNLVWMFFDILLPLFYLLLFGLGFSRAMGGTFSTGGQAVRYESFLLGGVLAMASFGIALNTSWGWFMDRDNGIFYEFLTYPMERGELLFGKVSFSMVVAFVQATLTLAAGVVLLRIPVVWSRVPLAVAGVMMGTVGWFFFFSIFALRIRRNDIYNTMINVLYFVLLFASSMFYPLDPMPAWMRWASTWNPMTWQVEFLRYATIGLGDARSLLWGGGLFLAFLAASFVGAIRSLRAQE